MVRGGRLFGGWAPVETSSVRCGDGGEGSSGWVGSGTWGVLDGEEGFWEVCRGVDGQEREFESNFGSWMGRDCRGGCLSCA